MKKHQILGILKTLAVPGILALAASCSSDIKDMPGTWEEYVKHNGTIYCEDSARKECFYINSGECPAGSKKVDECPAGYKDIETVLPGSSSSRAGGSSSGKESEEPPVLGDDGYFTDPRDGQKYWYEIAPNGTVWMGENLNYSRGGTIGWCYKSTGMQQDMDSTAGEEGSGCASPYGRTYTWEDAMDGNAPRGICPNGWHVPSLAEWQNIGAEFNNGYSSYRNIMSRDFYVLAGNYNFDQRYPPIGWKERDVNGFYWVRDGKNSFAGMWGEFSSFNEPPVLEIQTDPAPVQGYFSVRCVNDVAVDPPPQPPTIERCEGSCRWEDGCWPSVTDPTGEYGSIILTCADAIATCDKWGFGRYTDDACTIPVGGGGLPQPPSPGTGKGNNISNYNTVEIGSQVWMAENLDYAVEGSACYDCDTYGRLYDWATAMEVCPSGWHLPTQAEWEALSSYVESDKGCSNCDAKHLKATSGWYDWDGYSSGNGLDSYGFAALPGGNGLSGGYFNRAGNYGYWWSASEDGSSDAYRLRPMGYDYELAGWDYNYKTALHSVRCLQD